MEWNANTDRDGARVTAQREQVEVQVDARDHRVELVGNVIIVRAHFQSRERLLDTLNTVYYGVPPLLAIDFLDAPTFSSVTGTVGDATFVWQFARRAANLEVTNAARQGERFARAWERLQTLIPSENRRLFAAVQYLHAACRLERAGATPWEFMAEVLLNYAKLLEVLFPAGDGQGSIDAARTGLENLDYSSSYIEKWFIPAVALRNGLDVAHVSLAIFPRKQLQVLHAFTEQAEPHFRELVGKVVDRVASGELVIAPHTSDRPSKDADRIIRRMAAHFPAEDTNK